MALIKIKWTSGWKHRLVEPVAIQIHNRSILALLQETNGFISRYYRVSNCGLIETLDGFCWDGPTWFPDFKWMMIPSLVHDVLCWLIEQGILPESANDLIDEELSWWVYLMRKGKMSFLWKARRLYIGKATKLVDQKYGTIKRIHTSEVRT